MSDGVTHCARGGREGPLLAQESLGSWEGRAAGGLEVLLVHWGSAPVALGQSELSRQRHPLCFTESFDVGEEV